MPSQRADERLITSAHQRLRDAGDEEGLRTGASEPRPLGGAR